MYRFLMPTFAGFVLDPLLPFFFPVDLCNIGPTHSIWVFKTDTKLDAHTANNRPTCNTFRTDVQIPRSAAAYRWTSTNVARHLRAAPAACTFSVLAGQRLSTRNAHAATCFAVRAARRLIATNYEAHLTGRHGDFAHVWSVRPLPMHTYSTFMYIHVNACWATDRQQKRFDRCAREVNATYFAWTCLHC